MDTGTQSEPSERSAYRSDLPTGASPVPVVETPGATLPVRHWENWLIVLSLAFLASAISTLHTAESPDSSGADRVLPTGRAAELRMRIDPNVAPWWELAQLPGLGRKTAQAIVALRNKGPTPRYRTLDDLDDVPRIGPKTLQKIAPYLRFPDSEHSPAR